MTPFEKFLLALVIFWLAAQAAGRYGRAAGIPNALISLAETAVTI